MLPGLDCAENLKKRHQDFIREWRDVSIRMKTIEFVFVQPDHAGYIYGLRIDCNLNKHISPPPSSVEEQKQWIIDYAKRFEAGEEIYFLIRRLNGVPCGTVRLYNYQLCSFTAGSWILDKNKTLSAAVESACLVYKIGFDHLGFDACHFDVRKKNRSLSIHLRYGAEIKGEDEENVYLFLSKSRYNDYKHVLYDLIGSR